MKVLFPILSLIALASAASIAHPAVHHRKHHNINRSSAKAARCAAVKQAEASLSSASVASVSSVSALSTKSVHSVEATHTTKPKPKPTQDSNANSDSGNGGGGGGGGGDRYGGDLTFYEMGADACGGNDGPEDMVAAVAYRFFDSYPGAGPNPNNNPICGRRALVHYGGKSCVVRIVDKCMGCVMESLDLSPKAFQIFADLGAGRLHGMTWDWA